MDPQATIWARLGNLDWWMWAAFGLMLFIVCCAVVQAVTGIVREIKTPPPRGWADEALRSAGLIGPGILFLVWSPPGVFYSEGSDRGLGALLAWVAWPIFCYHIGHADGKKDV